MLVAAQSAVAADWERLLRVTRVELRTQVDSGLTSAQRYLFSRDIIPERLADATCRIFAAPGPALEAVEVVRILRNAARDGMPFDAMAILMRKPGHYQQVFEEALHRAGIPAYFTRAPGVPIPRAGPFSRFFTARGRGFPPAVSRSTCL